MPKLVGRGCSYGEAEAVYQSEKLLPYPLYPKQPLTTAVEGSRVCRKYQQRTQHRIKTHTSYLICSICLGLRPLCLYPIIQTFIISIFILSMDVIINIHWYSCQIIINRSTIISVRHLQAYLGIILHLQSSSIVCPFLKPN